ncbi:Aste57867_8802 [Aphanomyces stellatus]|uniref:Aste57867_8802 protein n=1 Tax=Aphanomyces stellatus TaxID=120398 RepID=A0A485KLL6_9STRA|nr:hypothetical protein As57867_008767 [Aphanomyces stellatus]VFT85688.1 Aste57867_8802 [Aphanomyces stellatus]
MLARRAAFRFLSTSPLRHPRHLWDLLHVSKWHPAAALEQSLLELKKMEITALDQLTSIPWGWDTNALAKEDEEFFKDVASEYHPEKDVYTLLPLANYSYSSAYVVDKDGKRVQSIRRRYEDSTGRLKAMHARRIQGKELVERWDRKHYDDKGVHESMCTDGTPEAFEKEWHLTPFGEVAKPIELGAPKEEKPTAANDAQGNKKDKPKDAQGSGGEDEAKGAVDAH